MRISSRKIDSKQFRYKDHDGTAPTATGCSWTDIMDGKPCFRTLVTMEAVIDGREYSWRLSEEEAKTLRDQLTDRLETIEKERQKRSAS